MAYAGHGYTRTTVEHHPDGSHTITHEHEDGKSHKKHAVMDLDGVHDSIEDHLNPEAYKEEEKAEEQIHPGIHQEVKEKMDEDDDG